MELNREDETYLRVYTKLLNFLSFSKRSSKEIDEKLKSYLSKERIPLREKEDIREKVLNKLKDDGYLSGTNDEDYAALYIEGLKKSSKPFNEINIRRFLSMKGISKDIVDEALNCVDRDSVYESALKDANKKVMSIEGKDIFTKKKKLLAYLYRKGYPYDIVSSVVDTLEELQ